MNLNQLTILFVLTANAYIPSTQGLGLAVDDAKNKRRDSVTAWRYHRSRRQRRRGRVVEIEQKNSTIKPRGRHANARYRRR